MASGRGGRWRWVQELVRKNGQGLAGLGGGQGDSRLQWACSLCPHLLSAHGATSARVSSGFCLKSSCSDGSLGRGS